MQQPGFYLLLLQDAKRVLLYDEPAAASNKACPAFDKHNFVTDEPDFKKDELDFEKNRS